jgi:lysozyme
LVTLNNKGLKSTAAGAYQFLASTWDDLKRKLNLPDFGPHSQDLAAQELIRERHALADVADGRFA